MARALGELQLAILRVLWETGEATVVDVHGALEERGLALTTVATMLRKMEDRGLVSHRSEGRRFIYRAALDEEETNQSLVGDLLDRAFGGDPSALVNHLLEERDINVDELAKLRRLINAKLRKARDEDAS